MSEILPIFSISYKTKKVLTNFGVHGWIFYPVIDMNIDHVKVYPVFTCISAVKRSKTNSQPLLAEGAAKFVAYINVATGKTLLYLLVFHYIPDEVI